MPFFAALLTSIAINVGIYLLTGFLSGSRKQEANKPTFPTADPDRYLPIIYGTVRLPINVFRTGRVETEEIRRTRNILFGFGPSDIIGHRYYYTFGAWLCHGKLDGFLDVIIDGKYFMSRITPQQVRDDDGINGTVDNTVTDVSGNTVTLRSPAYSTPTPMTGSATWFLGPAPTGINIDLKVPALFGDPVGPGGVQGRIKLYPGDGATIKNDALSAILPVGDPLYKEPAYPEYAHITAERVWLGNTGNPPGVEVVVARGAAKLGMGNPLNGYPASPWGGANNGFAQGDANPIGIIYEILVSSKLGIRFPRALIDISNFEAAYLALNPDTAGEFFGLSGTIFDQTSGEEAIKIILAHIDAVLFMSPATGLLTIRLIREFGGDPSSLPLLREDTGLMSLEWAETVQNDRINRIEVEFTNVYRDLKRDIVKADNLAAIQRAGRVNAERMQFLWCTRPDLALKIAQRELRVQTSKIGRGTFTMNRAGMMLTPGQHVRVTHPDVGTDVVCRIGAVDIGTLADGRISGTILQDRWASEESSYEAPPSADTGSVPGAAFYQPSVQVAIASDVPVSIVYNLIVGNPLGVVTSVEYAIQYGGDPLGPWIAGSGPPYALEVVKTLKSFRAFWRVAYLDPDGVTQYLMGEFPQPVSAVTPLGEPQLSYVYSGTDVIVTATLPNGATGFRAAGVIDSAPSDAAVLAMSPDTVAPFTYTTPAPVGTEVLYVGGASTDGTVDSRVVRLQIPPKPGTIAPTPAQHTIQYPFGNGAAMGAAGDWLATSPDFNGVALRWKARALDAARAQTPVSATFSVKKVRESDGALIDMVGGTLSITAGGENAENGASASGWAVPTFSADDEIIVTLETITAGTAVSLLFTLTVQKV